MIKKGVILESSGVQTPQQNGLAERKIWCIIQTAQALLFLNHVSKHFGVYVVVHKQAHGKFDLQAVKCVFLGYSLAQKEYVCDNPPMKKYLHLLMLSSINSNPTFSPKVLMLEKTVHRSLLREICVLHFPNHERLQKRKPLASPEAHFPKKVINVYQRRARREEEGTESIPS